MEEMHDLYIYGSIFLDLIKLIEAINRNKPTWRIKGFLDDNTNTITGSISDEYRILGDKVYLDKIHKDENTFFINNTAGNWKYQKSISEILLSKQFKIANLIHPAIDMNRVKVGKGCIIPEGCVIGGGSRIGDFVTVRLKSLISHDVTIEDYSFIGPGVSIGGYACLKKGCYIGIGAIIMGNVTIGSGSIVGAGSVVTKDIPPNTTVVGIPAKPMIKGGK